MPGFNFPEEDARASDDVDPGYFRAWLGMTLQGGRYRISRKLGWGSCSTVWLVRDSKLEQYAALKIMTRAATSTCEAGQSGEIKMLQKISFADRSHRGSHHLVEYYDTFEIAGSQGPHRCIVTEVLGSSLEDLRRQVSYRLPLHIVKTSVRHILLGLDYLHMSCGIVHTDIKFDNVMLRLPDMPAAIARNIVEDPSRVRKPPANTQPAAYMVKSQPIGLNLDSLDLRGVDVVIADLGHSHWVRHHFREEVQPDRLRAPEVMLGRAWNQAVDVWSLGCLTAELLVGSAVFEPTIFRTVWDLDEEHLAQMTDLLEDQFPAEMLDKSKHRSKYFREDGAFIHSTESRGTNQPLSELLTEWSNFGRDTQEVNEAVRFLKRCLQLQPENRAAAKELAEDPWLVTE